MLEEAALASWADHPEERPHCPDCTEALQARGCQEQGIKVQGDQEVRLRRRYEVCPACGAGVSPLDEELDLLPGKLFPWLVEWVARLGTWLALEQVPEAVAFFTKVGISEETARRLTEEGGAAQVVLEAAMMDSLEREDYPSPPGPPVQQVSVDGAMVPLVGGERAEVKTVAVGALTRYSEGQKARGEVHAEELSYFSRLADSPSFTRAVPWSYIGGGSFRAGTVVAPMEGAE